MCIDTVVPVSKANNVNYVACFKCFNLLINIGISICEIAFNAETIFYIVVTKSNINIFAA